MIARATPAADPVPVQVTEYDNPATVVHSYRGRIDNRLWSEIEADGLAAAGIAAYVKENGGRRIAVWRGNPGRDVDVVYVPNLFGNARRNA